MADCCLCGGALNAVARSLHGLQLGKSSTGLTEYPLHAGGQARIEMRVSYLCDGGGCSTWAWLWLKARGHLLDAHCSTSSALKTISAVQMACEHWDSDEGKEGVKAGLCLCHGALFPGQRHVGNPSCMTGIPGHEGACSSA